MRRRNFLIKILKSFWSAVILGSIYPIFRFLYPKLSTNNDVDIVKVGRVEDFTGRSFRLYKFGRRRIILIQLGENRIVALSAKCTHLGCTVRYIKSRNIIKCPCHGGEYSIDGRVLKGPPKKPLQKYDVKVRNGEIYIARI
jgi:cytochrome b6-f complex iron-sulfur subunit